MKKRKTELRPGIGYCDDCGEERWPQRYVGYGMMVCEDCLTSSDEKKTSQRRCWRVGQLIAFQHGPDRKNIFRFRVTKVGPDGRPSEQRLVQRQVTRN